MTDRPDADRSAARQRRARRAWKLVPVAFVALVAVVALVGTWLWHRADGEDPAAALRSTGLNVIGVAVLCVFLAGLTAVVMAVRRRR